MPSVQPGILLARGVCRALVQHGWSVLTEVTLANGRRADIMALLPDGDIVIIEVKSSLEDFRADRKWGEYREFCDSLYFAVSDGFPHELIPADCGLIAADAFGAEILRLAPVARMAPARRKALTLRFAQLAAQRLQRLLDAGPMP
ncbi:MAG: MmcB family DNA repair protein [Aliidongia sp.]